MNPPRDQTNREKEMLKEAIQKFLKDFEASKKTENAMKAILAIWEDNILSHARRIGGNIHLTTQTLINVCKDYAHYRGMIERVRQELEEIRIFFDL